MHGKFKYDFGIPDDRGGLDPEVSALPAKPPEGRCPDALLVHTNVMADNSLEAHREVIVAAHKAMGIPLTHPPTVWIAKQDKWRFCFPKRPDSERQHTIHFATGSAGLEKKSRYDWYQVSEAVLYGFLTDEAKAEDEEYHRNLKGVSAPPISIVKAHAAPWATPGSPPV